MRKLMALGLLIFTWSLSAQTDSLSDLSPELSGGRINRPFFDVFTEQGAASSQLSSSQMWTFFNSDFIEEEQKDQMMDRASSSGLNMGLIQTWEFRLCYVGHHQSRLKPFPKRSIYLYNRGYAGVGLSSDLSRLFLYGNRATAGEAQDIGGFEYESWFYSGIGHQFTFMVDTVPVSLGLSLVAVHSLDDHQTGSASLFTESDGSAIQFTGDYNFGQSGANSSFGITGWGLSLNLESAERYKEHELRLGIQDLGFAYMTHWREIARDSSFTFSGVDAGSLFTLDQARFDQLQDSLQGGLLGSLKEGAWKLLPFKLDAEYRYHIKQQFLYAKFSYLNIATYLPRVALGYAYCWDNFDLQSGLAYGGFNGFSMDLDLRWRINRRYHLRAGLSNVFGVALPTWSGGTIGNIGCRYIF